tara:strand:+ start:110 stop:505 length:396 start_codon:yes stop_codon:yes gene_type:complete
MSKSIRGISVQLPLVYGQSDGPYILNKNIGQVIKQNFKNLVLTSPGERVMEPEFGVGLRQLLFEGISSRTYQVLEERLLEQINDYMPFLNVEEVDFLSADNTPEMDLNAVTVRIVYNVGSIDSRDTLSIEV